MMSELILTMWTLSIILITWGVSTDNSVDDYEEAYAVVKEEQCVIYKPSGTVCVYEGSWVAKPIENEGE